MFKSVSLSYSQLIYMLLVCLLSVQSANANPQHLAGVWHEIHAYSATDRRDTFIDEALKTASPVVKGVKLTGGHFLYIAPLNITQWNEYVLDFKNTSTIGQFRHDIYNNKNQLIASLEGGIESTVPNPFFYVTAAKLIYPLANIP